MLRGSLLRGLTRLPARGAPAAEANGEAIFAVPHRHSLFYAPMVDLGVVESINRIIPLAVSLFNEGPGSISPGLYWWRDGSITL